MFLKIKQFKMCQRGKQKMNNFSLLAILFLSHLNNKYCYRSHLILLLHR